MGIITQHHGDRLSKTDAIAFLCITTVFCLLFYLENAGHPIYHSLLNNSDSLYLPILFNNLFTHNGHISDWYLTPAPYFFPDYLLFSIAYMASNTIPSQVFIYATLQISLLLVLLYFFFKFFAPSTARYSSLLATLLLVYLGLKEIQPYPLLFHSAYHFGCFLMEIMASILWLNWFKKNRHNDLILLIFVAFITTLSDSLFFTQWILPSLLAACLFKHQHKQPINIRDLSPCLASLFGFVLYPYVVTHATRYSMRFNIHQMPTHLLEVKRIFLQIFAQGPIVSLFILIFYGTLSVIFILILLKKIQLHPTVAVGYAFLLIATGTTIMPPLVVAHFEATSRYFIPIFVWPVIVSIAVLTTKINIFRRLTLPLSAILTGILVMACVTFCQQHHHQDYYPKELACIDNMLNHYPNLHHGIAEYWDAKRYQAYSQHDLTLAQYHNERFQHHWITSEDYFRSSYDFAIRKAEDKTSLTTRPPLKIVPCGTRTLWIYGQNNLVIRPDYPHQ